MLIKEIKITKRKFYMRKDCSRAAGGGYYEFN